MRTTWTREAIIRHIIECEDKGIPFTVGGRGINSLLYSAARRIFGSWRNAILAAGIPPERILTWERWTPDRVLAQIRRLSARSRPLSTEQLERRYGNLVTAARRHFGSWTKAARAAGVKITTLQRVVPWNEARVVEAILTRELRGESLVARLVQPRSLTDAAYRLFGSWREAVSAAGLDPSVTEMSRRKHVLGERAERCSPTTRRYPYLTWKKEKVVEFIQRRVHERKPVNAYAVTRDFPKLYAAANRHFGGWSAALRAAGLDPDACRKKPVVLPPHKSPSLMANVP